MNLMNYLDYNVIIDVFDAFEKEEYDLAEKRLDNKFNSTILDKEVSKTEFVELYKKIKMGMPDAVFSIENLILNGDSLTGKVKITGTHTHPMPPLKRGWKSGKPTGKKINKIVSSIEVIMKGSKILEIRNVKEKKGVAAGLLNELDLLPKSYSLN
ncbi:MAG: ester cyclase [Chitinophagaceae bacterium]|nr:ester cyclase [Chitinophagaceae bacterium]